MLDEIPPCQDIKNSWKLSTVDAIFEDTYVKFAIVNTNTLNIQKLVTSLKLALNEYSIFLGQLVHIDRELFINYEACDKKKTQKQSCGRKCL